MKKTILLYTTDKRLAKSCLNFLFETYNANEYLFEYYRTFSLGVYSYSLTVVSVVSDNLPWQILEDVYTFCKGFETAMKYTWVSKFRKFLNVKFGIDSLHHWKIAIEGFKLAKT